MTTEPITYRRADLYEQVWAEPVHTVAQRYGVSDVAVAKACRRLGVPLPGRGYWAKKAAGQDLPRPPLRQLPAGRRDGIPVRRVHRASAVELPLPGPTIAVSDSLVDAHALVASAAKLLGRAKLVDGMLSCQAQKCLNVVVSPACLDRALRIMDALVKGLEARGLRVMITAPPEPDEYGRRGSWGPGLPDHDTRVLVDGQWISFGLFEHTIPGPDTEASSPGGWPRVSPRVPTGQLVLRILNQEWPAGRNRWQDGLRQRVESCLNAFIVQLHVRAASIAKGRADELARRQRYDEEERQRREAARQRWEDEQRAKELLAALERWRLARDLQQYVSEARGLVADAKLHIIPGSSLDQELTWAEGYADRIDPLSRVRADIAASLRAQAEPVRDET